MISINSKPIEIYLSLYRNNGTCVVTDGSCKDCPVHCVELMSSCTGYQQVKSARYKKAEVYLNEHQDELMEKLL